MSWHLVCARCDRLVAHWDDMIGSMPRKGAKCAVCGAQVTARNVVRVDEATLDAIRRAWRAANEERLS